MKPAEGSSRRVLLILGMHRSGTSAVTRVLNLLGADLGERLVAPAADNPAGFWEHADAVKINDDLLQALGRTWYDMRDMPANWLESDAAKAASRSIEKLIGRDFANSRLCAVKDPRMCLTAPLWISEFGKQGFVVDCLFVVRNPNEVIESLHVRNGWPRTPLFLMWVQYLLEAEAATRECDRTLITFDQLLANWRSSMGRVAEHFCMEWPNPIDTVVGEVDAFLDRKLRHHAVNSGRDSRVPGGEPLPELVHALYQSALQLSEGRRGWSMLRTLHDSFRRAAELYDEHVNRLLKERWDAEARAQTAETRIEQRASADVVAQENLQTTRQAVEQWLDKLNKRVEGVDQQSRTLNAELSLQIAEQTKAATAGHNELRKWNEDLAAKLDTIEQRVGEVGEQSRSMNAEREVQISELAAGLHRHRETISAVEARLQRQHGLLNTALLRMEQVNNGVDQMLNGNSAQSRRIEALDVLLNRDLADTKAQLLQLTAALDDSNARLAGLVSSTSWRLTAPLRWISVHILRRPAPKQ